MNRQHFTAFVWLRWRLMANQWRRGGAVNAWLMTVVAFGALLTAVPLFIGSFLLARYAIPKAEPVHLLYAWDGLIVAFLFFWCIGLIVELQRTEALALSKFLHLPVSVNSAFLLNYLGSLVRLSLIVFVPLMLGYALALVVAKGMVMWTVLPLLAAFLLMVTALTYQLQGWLAALMSNPRRRRTVVVALTGGIVLLAQLPNLLNFLAPWGSVRWTQRRVERSQALVAELAKLDRAARAGEFDPQEHVRRQKVLMEEAKRLDEQADHELAEQGERTARLANLALPIGWLPLGVMTAAEGRALPSLLGLAGMTLIGAASLRSAYRATVAHYQGRPTNRKGRPAAAPSIVRPSRVRWLEARIPGLSEPVAAVALASFQSMARAPEAKMMLLSSLIMGVIFGSMLWQSGADLPKPARPLIAIGAMGFELLGLLQLMANQFGFDRDGFRVFVLSSASRRDILLGKNLAFAPMALGTALILLALTQAVCPMRGDHLLAMFPLYVAMFLLFCLFANLVSILAPVYIAGGALKAANPKLSTVLLQLLFFLVLFPLTQAPALLPLGVEVGLGLLGWTTAVPVCLLLSLAECLAVVVLYRVALRWQGGLFQAREQRVLESVTNRAT